MFSRWEAVLNLLAIPRVAKNLMSSQNANRGRDLLRPQTKRELVIRRPSGRPYLRTYADGPTTF